MLREFFTSPDKWAAICDRSYSSCIDGSFEPSGYLLKAALLHSGEPLERLSDIQHDALEPKILSHLMKYRRQPTPLRGYGYVYLRNLLPSLAGPPGDSRTLFVKDGLNLLPNQEYHFVVETAKGANGSKLKVVFSI
jgi:hypothetical protein